jgi:hypothetical protein
LQYNPTTNQETSIKVFTKNLDYVIGTLMQTGYKTIGGAYNGSILSSGYFLKFINPDINWNFKINQRQLFHYNATHTDALISMKSIFPNKVHATGVSATPNIVFSCGTKVGFTNEYPEEIEVSFTTTAGTTTTANFSLLFAKINNTITLN